MIAVVLVIAFIFAAIFIGMCVGMIWGTVHMIRRFINRRALRAQGIDWWR